jgi:hypothetical protein
MVDRIVKSFLWSTSSCGHCAPPTMSMLNWVLCSIAPKPLIQFSAALVQSLGPYVAVRYPPKFSYFFINFDVHK